jgi:hypothetical protein
MKHDATDYFPGPVSHVVIVMRPLTAPAFGRLHKQKLMVALVGHCYFKFEDCVIVGTNDLWSAA